MNMCIYHAITKSNTLPLDNKETPSIVLLSFASFFTYRYDCSFKKMHLNSRIIIIIII